MGKLHTEDDEVDLLAAAFLVGEGRTQGEIAETLGLNTTAVSRMLSKEGKEYLHIEPPRFLREKITPELMDRVLERTSRSNLQKRIQHHAIRHNQVRGPVLRVFSCDAPVSNVRERMNELGRRAAPYLRSLICGSRLCGLTWGGMLRSAVLGLRALHIPSPWSKKPEEPIIECIPLSGEPLGNDPTDFSSSSLAHDLGNLINGEHYNAPSMAMVPAFIPEGFTKQELQGVRKLIGLVRPYDQIFGQQGPPRSEQPLANTVDMILTSVGPAERPLGFGQGRLFETGKITFDELQNLVIGDVGGVCLGRPGLSKSDVQKLESIKERWTGLRESHLAGCAARARSNADRLGGPPGVVVVSGGKARAQFIYEIIKRGLVNHLIIDDELERELVSIID